MLREHRDEATAASDALEASDSRCAEAEAATAYAERRVEEAGYEIERLKEELDDINAERTEAGLEPLTDERLAPPDVAAAASAAERHVEEEDALLALM